MPICIECRYPVSTLYTTYSKADDKALGKGVRLTQCPRCKRFADKYVEHDFVVLFIDLVLIKPQIRTEETSSWEVESKNGISKINKTAILFYVYRHLLFNRLGREDERLDPSIIRLGVLLLLFDVYLTWARIEKAMPNSPSLPLSPPPPLSASALFDQSSNNSSHNSTAFNGTLESLSDSVPSRFLAAQPILLQYLFFLALCTIETLSFHLPIRALLSARLWRPFADYVPHYPHAALVSTALLVSSFTKLFPLMLLVWKYDLPSSASAVSWAVIINNIAALEILLDCGYIWATVLAGVGAVFRAGVGWGILRAVGVGGGPAAAGVVETGDLIVIWGRLMESIGLG